MKIIYIILITFLLTLLTSGLLEFDFIKKNPIRYALVVILIIIEILTAYYLIRANLPTIDKNE